ncbi:anthranilate phosphoribosyltransferase [Deinococcus radiophilus]|uniref:Anthranilate phosphoribosyltransferase n=1 Tax=Deinococcus radiophilus TaxID=32062 RepID=A0A3S0IIZ9_9DEIO|nr:anthranilate phosphoribosyltransferase [Deinococcus radiophilus]RTR24700.1 anthranilate phosphoribosyltransferase [Deinococcus radiophilus]UFA51628.1 anthranilate phosphoribosyltransferase [Deinococcus radiophilus]
MTRNIPTPELLKSALLGQRLTRTEARRTFQAMIDGEFTEGQMAGLLIAMKTRGETAEEVAGAALAYRDACLPFPEQKRPIADCVGTGGDMAGTINISTAAALAASSLGVPVAKHGNRSVSSLAGSADLAEALGLPIGLSREEAARQLEQHNFCYIFATQYHPAVGRIMPLRRALAVPTLLNLLGPLLNPARPTRQLLGVARAEVAPLLANTLAQLGRTHALVVHGSGLDEIALHGPTQVYEVTEDGAIEHHTLTPADLGLKDRPLSDLVGGTAQDNARMIREVMEGRGQDAHREAIAAATGALLYLTGDAPSLRAGVAAALDQLASGRVAEHVERLKEPVGA